MEPEKVTDENQSPRETARFSRLPSLRKIGLIQDRTLSLLVFVIVFGAIGTYVLLSSYAATPAPGITPVSTVILRSGLTNSGRRMCLDDYQYKDANGTPVISFPCNAEDPGQQWTLYANGTIRIHGTECLDIKTPFNKPGALAITYVCNDAKSQTQIWSPGGSSLANNLTSSALTNGDAPHLCLTDPNGGASHTQLEVDDCSGASDQTWTVQSYKTVSAVKPGMAALQVMYDNTKGSSGEGLFCNGKLSGQCWWDSANELNDIINYTEQTGDTSYESDISNTFRDAGYSLQSPQETQQHIAFADKYNDDDGWWGLTWLNAYKLTGNKDYLKASEALFGYMQANWTPTCGGGVDQFNGGLSHDTNQPSVKDAIANGLYISLGARLYQATGNQTYLTGKAGAETNANWFLASGLVVQSGSQAGLIEDHVDNPAKGAKQTDSLGDCPPASTSKSTYNQGMILNGLADLSKIAGTGGQKYLTAAQTTANAVLADKNNSNPALIDANGVLTEPCTGAPYSCKQSGQDFLQWKGPFIRSLYCLNAVVPTATYTDFFGTNANAILQAYPVGASSNPFNGKNGKGLDFYGFTWDKYSSSGMNAATQGSALDAVLSNLGGSTTMCSG